MRNPLKLGEAAVSLGVVVFFCLSPFGISGYQVDSVDVGVADHANFFLGDEYYSAFNSGLNSPYFLQEDKGVSGLFDPELYDGRLLVYVVEPVSRWNDFDGDPFGFGFLDFAADESLSILLNTTYNATYYWDAQAAGFLNVSEENIMVIAVVYNPKMHEGLIHSPPPHDDILFDAYYVDASAEATPNHTGWNMVAEGFSHAVFCEEVTASFCAACPPTAKALQSIYHSHDYPFHYAALIFENNKTVPRLLEYFTTGIAFFPTCFFDGGKEVIVGGGSNLEAYYRNVIEQMGERDVHELNLSVSLAWIGNGSLEVNVSITNNEIVREPDLGIGEVASQWGGLGHGGVISAEILNNGNAAATNVNWGIEVAGGIIGRVSINDTGEIEQVDADSSVTISSITPIIGLGNIEINITADDLYQRGTGFLIGPFLFL